MPPMTAEEREQFYDREIAPVLLELARKCQDSGLSMATMVEWAPGETGETIAMAADASIKMRMAVWAIQAHGNVDSLIMALMSYGRRNGHNSVCLKILEGTKEKQDAD